MSAAKRRAAQNGRDLANKRRFRGQRAYFSRPGTNAMALENAPTVGVLRHMVGEPGAGDDILRRRKTILTASVSSQSGPSATLPHQDTRFAIGQSSR